MPHYLLLIVFFALNSSCNSLGLGSPSLNRDAGPPPKAQPIRLDGCMDESRISMDTQARPTALMNSYKHFSYTTFEFEQPDEHIEDVSVNVTLCNVPPKRTYGMYLQIFMTIGGNETYFGIQTELSNPSTGRSAGPGFIFSRWGALNPKDLKIAPGGFSEVGAHERGFVGVRLPRQLQPGRYKFRLTNTAGSWYELKVSDPVGETFTVGSLKLAGTEDIARFTVVAEAYAMKNVPMVDLPLWQIVVDPKVNGERAISGAVSYPSSDYPFGRVTHANESSNAINILYGSKTSRKGTINGSFEP